MPNQNWVWGVYIYHKYWDNTRFRQKKLHAYDFQVRLWVAAFLAFLVLKFWKCGKMWPSISKWTYTCQKNLKIQVRKYSAFDLAFLTFVGLFKILLRSLRCKKSGGMQESCTLAFYHQKQFSLKISHFESVCSMEIWKNLGIFHRRGPFVQTIFQLFGHNSNKNQDIFLKFFAFVHQINWQKKIGLCSISLPAMAHFSQKFERL